MNSPDAKKLTKKWWHVKTSQGTLSLLPVFLVDEKTQEVECKEVVLRLDGKEHRVNFDNLYMFMYFVSNEELRRKLMQRYERTIYEIPYEVSFKLDKDERDRGEAKRLIKLKVDDITMAMVRSEAALLRSKNPALQKLFKGT